MVVRSLWAELGEVWLTGVLLGWVVDRVGWFWLVVGSVVVSGGMGPLQETGEGSLGKGGTGARTQGHRPPTQRAGRRETRPAARGADGENEELRGNAPPAAKPQEHIPSRRRSFNRIGLWRLGMRQSTYGYDSYA